MSLISGVHVEGTGTGVHTGQVLAVDDFLNGQFADVIPMLVVSMLSQKSNGSLGIVRVELRHIEVVDVIDHSDLSSGTVLLTSQLLQGSLQHSLQVSRVSVEVAVDLGVSEVLGVFRSNRSDDVVGQLGLSGSGSSDDQRRVSDVDEGVDELFGRDGFSGGDGELLHLVVLLGIEVNGLDLLGPFLELDLVASLVDKVVED